MKKAYNDRSVTEYGITYSPQSGKDENPCYYISSYPGAMRGEYLKQWHAEPDPFYGGASPAEFFSEQLDDRARQVERTVDQLRAWRPEPARRGRARKAATA